MKKNKLKIVMVGLVLVLIIGQTVFAAGNYKIQALKMNTFVGKGNDTTIFANGVKNNISSYTYTVNSKTTAITTDDFYNNSSYIKFWSSHGLTTGKLYGSQSGNCEVNVKDINPSWAGGNLEFVFIAACNQLNGTAGLRSIYAKAMRGSNAVRVISGYHDTAPGDADAAITQKFIDYAKTGESVKSSWILANEYYKNDDSVGGYNARNYCVLTHSGNVQYSRIEGFSGGTYTRPGASSTTILRFSAANPDGAIEIQSTNALKNLEVPNYALRAKPIDISVIGPNEIKNVSENQKVSVVNKEIGDTKISMTKEQVIETGLEWLDINLKGLSSSQLKNGDMKITPIVMAEVDTEGNGRNEVEDTVAYILNYNNFYNGIRISGEGYDTIIDTTGVIAANAKWSEFEQINNKSQIQSVSYEQAKQIVNNSLRTAYSLQLDAELEATTDMKADIAFVFDEKDGLYYPTWIFNGNESVYKVNCLTGELY